jgi:hypothetical protein
VEKSKTSTWSVKCQSPKKSYLRLFVALSRETWPANRFCPNSGQAISESVKTNGCELFQPRTSHSFLAVKEKRSRRSFVFRKLHAKIILVKTKLHESLDTTLYNPCQVRVAAPRGPARRTIHETCGQDVIPDGRYDLRVYSTCRSGSSGTGGRRADPVVHRTKLPLRWPVYIRAAPKQLLKFNRLAIAKAMPAFFLVLSGLSIGPCSSPFFNGVI